LDLTYKEKEILSEQLENLQTPISQVNNKAFELEKEIYNLRGTINEKDEYILNLKKVILEMRDRQPLYIPRKVK
jgi:hypothetical protein